MISVGAHILVLHAASLGCTILPNQVFGPINGQYENITKLLMTTTRLLNDIQSYQVSPLIHALMKLFIVTLCYRIK